MQPTTIGEIKLFGLIPGELSCCPIVVIWCPHPKREALVTNPLWGDRITPKKMPLSRYTLSLQGRNSRRLPGTLWLSSICATLDWHGGHRSKFERAARIGSLVVLLMSLMYPTAWKQVYTSNSFSHRNKGEGEAGAYNQHGVENASI